MALVKNRFLKQLLFFLGVFSLALGTIGAFLPLIPTTPFVLLAAWCFLKSSKKAHDWIYRQPLFGKALTNWEKNKIITRPTKLLAISMILLSLLLIWLKVDDLWIKYSVTTLLLVVMLFIATRREHPL